MNQESNIQDPYEILQVHPKADLETINHMHRYLAGKYHPDTVPTNLKAEYEERMKRINAAYDMIINSNNGSHYSGSCGVNDCRMEIVNTLMEVANAGGGKNDCYRKSIFILQSIVSENQGLELEYIAHGKIAEIQFVYLHDYKSAAVTLEVMLQRNPNPNDYDTILATIIACNINEHNLSNALNYCDIAINSCTSIKAILGAYLNKGDILDDLHKYDDAINIFQYVILHYRNMDEAAYAQYRIARILDSGLQKYPASIVEYRKVLHEFGDSEWAKDCQWRIDYIQRKHIEKKGWWE